MGYTAPGPSRDPPYGQPGKAESRWFVKLCVRGPSCWFTYQSTAGVFFSCVLKEALNPPTHRLWCSRGRWFCFLYLSRELSVLTASVCHEKAQLALYKLMDCLGSQSFVFILGIHTETTRRGTKATIHTIYMCLCLLLCYFQADSERNHTCHIVFHSPFSFWPRGEARQAFWQ